MEYKDGVLKVIIGKNNQLIENSRKNIYVKDIEQLLEKSNQLLLEGEQR